eukprot:1141743-Pelagomonas_calceolata.AAC.4
MSLSLANVPLPSMLSRSSSRLSAFSGSLILRPIKLLHLSAAPNHCTVAPYKLLAPTDPPDFISTEANQAPASQLHQLTVP